jgi:MFS family permease
MFWTLGSVVEASLAWAVLPSLGWRWLLAISALPLAVLLIAYPLLPESPRFLLGVNGDAVGARKVLAVCRFALPDREWPFCPEFFTVFFGFAGMRCWEASVPGRCE